MGGRSKRLGGRSKQVGGRIKSMGGRSKSQICLCWTVGVLTMRKVEPDVTYRTGNRLNTTTGRIYDF